MGFGIVFDIDGVLLHGHEPIPAAKEAMALLHAKGATVSSAFPCPVVCLTNAGYVPASRLEDLNDQIDARMDLSQLIVSHSPVQGLLSSQISKPSDEIRLLLCSTTHEQAEKVALFNGWKNWISVQALHFLYPALYPPYQTQEEDRKRLSETPRDVLFPFDCTKEGFDAVVLLNDPAPFWPLHLQVLCDVLRSPNGTIPDPNIPLSNDQRQALLSSFSTSDQVVKLVICNPDVVYGDKYHLPRFTTGAFLLCLETMYKSQMQRDLTYSLLGKPFKATYDFTELQLQTQQNPDSSLETIYAIGDNPVSDIQGANNAGARWFSILVRSGCFVGDNHPIYPAKHVCDNVLDAIHFILEREGL